MKDYITPEERIGIPDSYALVDIPDYYNTASRFLYYEAEKNKMLAIKGIAPNILPKSDEFRMLIESQIEQMYGDK